MFYLFDMGSSIRKVKECHKNKKFYDYSNKKQVLLKTGIIKT